MHLTDAEEAMRDGREGKARQKAMELRSTQRIKRIIITETRHELGAQSFKDKILVCRGATGSSGWSAMYHITRLAGTALKALIFNEMTTKIALGAVVMRVPSVTDLDQNPLESIETGDWVTVDGDNGMVEVQKATAKSLS